ncbi:MAG: Ureidoglycolate hydrolase [Leptolyngbyaceae cyanobacterium CRU_2_3]|nr:Ureidoglycolate hydrolase [Leptolyngbyaceae cyanobacterium CRU_2_3]
MASMATLRQLPAQWIASENFRAFGQVIYATPDGKPYDSTDAQLILQGGIPRFYIMRLLHKGRRFGTITRHLRCTQCLGSLEGKDWLIAVAPANQTESPVVEAISAFRVPGNCLIKLNLGTWHAGPYFEHDFVDFYNLELSDTNSADHDTYSIEMQDNLQFEII